MRNVACRVTLANFRADVGCRRVCYTCCLYTGNNLLLAPATRIVNIIDVSTGNAEELYRVLNDETIQRSIFALMRSLSTSTFVKIRVIFHPSFSWYVQLLRIRVDIYIYISSFTIRGYNLILDSPLMELEWNSKGSEFHNKGLKYGTLNGFDISLGNWDGIKFKRN